MLLGEFFSNLSGNNVIRWDLPIKNDPSNKPSGTRHFSFGKFQCPLAVTMCVTKILVSHAAGICESEIPSITSFVALMKDSGVP